MLSKVMLFVAVSLLWVGAAHAAVASAAPSPRLVLKVNNQLDEELRLTSLRDDSGLGYDGVNAQLPAAKGKKKGAKRVLATAAGDDARGAVGFTTASGTQLAVHYRQDLCEGLVDVSGADSGNYWAWSASGEPQSTIVIEGKIEGNGVCVLTTTFAKAPESFEEPDEYGTSCLGLQDDGITVAINLTNDTRVPLKLQYANVAGNWVYGPPSLIDISSPASPAVFIKAQGNHGDDQGPQMHLIYQTTNDSSDAISFQMHNPMSGCCTWWTPSVTGNNAQNYVVECNRVGESTPNKICGYHHGLACDGEDIIVACTISYQPPPGTPEVSEVSAEDLGLVNSMTCDPYELNPSTCSLKTLDSNFNEDALDFF